MPPSEIPAAWTAWQFEAGIAGGSALFAALYLAGMRKTRVKERFSGRWRHGAFFGGMGALFLALESPLDGLAEHSFFIHQIQHLVLQTVAPILLMLAAPQATLVAGFPAPLRRALVAPLMASRPVRAVFGFLLRPWVAAALLVASLYAWHWPAWHDLALRDDRVHYLMHVTLLAGGLVFFGCVLDARPPPLGARYGARVNALVAAMTACMVLGVVLALKRTPWYPAYGDLGRLPHLSALGDERLGGLIMWIPGSAAWVPAFLVLLRRWDGQEARLHERRRRGIAAGAAPGTAGNTRVALLTGLVALGGFAATLAIGWIVTRAHPDLPDRETAGSAAVATGFVMHASPQPVPELRFADGAGRKLSLARFRGRTVLLNVWATWCVPCRKEMPALDRLQQKLGGPGFQVLALSIDTEGAPAVKTFFRQIGVRALAVYVDPSARATETLGLPGIPTTLLVGRDGRELGRKTGPAEWDTPAAIGMLEKYLPPGPPTRP